MKSEHKISKEDKLQYLGDGEWIDEPDKVTFEHEGYDCMILRIFIKEIHTFVKEYTGGNLCGYVRIPAEHPWYGKDGFIYKEIPVDCHGGLSFSDYIEGRFWIGFDCAHSGDIIPSMEHRKKTDLRFKEIYAPTEELKLRYPMCALFNSTYKNINFVIQECKSIAEQAKERVK